MCPLVSLSSSIYSQGLGETKDLLVFCLPKEFDMYTYPLQWVNKLRVYGNFNLREKEGCQDISVSQHPQIANMKQNLFLKHLKKSTFM